jgi:hypothetical protein
MVEQAKRKEKEIKETMRHISKKEPLCRVGSISLLSCFLKFCCPLLHI